ncbi:hypothetical protein SDC9_77625 [bioreactor metagenome]|uniref:Uncharacterized protein n=1 Tax=bioreactor metagenome TaxID=1076179 RepID=A0A644YR46_9ZZZZ
MTKRKNENGGRRGKKALCNLSADELSLKIGAYFSHCGETGWKPNWQGFAVFLGETSETLTRWMEGGSGEEAEIARLLKKAADTISDQLQQRTDSMAMISVKQTLYGGFAEKPRENSDRQVTIQVRFGGKDKEAYGK